MSLLAFVVVLVLELVVLVAVAVALVRLFRPMAARACAVFPCEAPCLPCLDSGSIAGRCESCRLQMADVVSGQARVISHDSLPLLFAEYHTSGQKELKQRVCDHHEPPSEPL